MSKQDKHRFRVRKWTEFQNDRLLPAVNRILGAGATHVPSLSGPGKAYTKSQRSKLTHLQFFAANLYTKEQHGAALQFYKAVNRYLLQPNAAKTGITVNEAAYDDDKKVFNVWLYLFLSGLQRLMVKVPRLFANEGRSKKTVRLFRGMAVDEKLSDSLWKSPELKSASKSKSKSTSSSKSSSPGAELNVYTTLGFSSFTPDVNVACDFFSASNPNIFVYEPRMRPHADFYLPCLKAVSDIPTENEFLIVPGLSVIVYSKEKNVAQSRLNVHCTPPRPVTWIGLTDITGATALDPHIKADQTESGGATRRNKQTSRTTHTRKNKMSWW